MPALLSGSVARAATQSAQPAACHRRRQAARPAARLHTVCKAVIRPESDASYSDSLWDANFYDLDPMSTHAETARHSMMGWEDDEADLAAAATALAAAAAQLPRTYPPTRSHAAPGGAWSNVLNIWDEEEALMLGMSAETVRQSLMSEDEWEVEPRRAHRQPVKGALAGADPAAACYMHCWEEDELTCHAETARHSMLDYNNE